MAELLAADRVDMGIAIYEPEWNPKCSRPPKSESMKELDRITGGTNICGKSGRARSLR